MTGHSEVSKGKYSSERAAGSQCQHLDHIWARLPFLVPMAAKIAGTCCGGGPACRDLAKTVEELRSLLLGHLEREEEVLRRLATSWDNEALAAELRALYGQHRDVQSLMSQVLAQADELIAGDTEPCATVLAFHREVVRVAEHVRSQIELEDNG